MSGEQTKREAKGKPMNPRQESDAGNPLAEEYLRWVAIQKRKQELLSKLAVTSGVDDKFRDPEYVKAKEEYTGSVPDLARRALEASAVPGNVLKATMKAPTDPELSRVDQVASAVKAAVGSPEAAFRENRVMGADVLADSDMTDRDKAILGTALDVGADVVGMAGAVKGAQLAGKGLANVAGKTVGAAQGLAKAAGKAMPEASAVQKQLGSLDLPPAKAIEPENAAMFQKLEKDQLLKELDQRQAIMDSQAAKQADVDAFRARPEFREVDIEPKSLISPVDIPKMQEEILMQGGPALAPKQAIKSITNNPTLQEKIAEIKKLRALTNRAENKEAKDFAAEVVLGAQEKANLVKNTGNSALDLSDNVRRIDPDIPFGQPTIRPRVLKPNEPVTAKKLVQGLEQYGTSDTSKKVGMSRKEINKMLDDKLKAAKKPENQVAALEKQVAELKAKAKEMQSKLSVSKEDWDKGIRPNEKEMEKFNELGKKQEALVNKINKLTEKKK